MAAVFGKYVHLLEKYPLATKSITGAVIASLSDIICQKLQQSN